MKKKLSVLNIGHEVKSEFGQKGYQAFHKAVSRKISQGPDVVEDEDGKRWLSDSFFKKWKRDYKQRNGQNLSKRARISLPQKTIDKLAEVLKQAKAKTIKDLLKKIGDGKLVVSEASNADA